MKIRTLLLTAVVVGCIAPANVYADDYVDDIYFNPKKDNFVGAKKKNPNYIENFGDMDVDAYNKRGQYYATPIDTIGAKVSSDEDFVYTQQIQKYYNPTIVLDNSQLLADVLENSYGNVEIVYNGLTPAFLPAYGYGWPYYTGYYNPWSWSIGGWGWSIGGWYDPWYWGPSWSLGPSWAWGPSWSWGWGPSWGWGGPAWVGSSLGWGRPNGTWSPGGNRPINPGTGWAGNHRNPVNNRPGVNTPGNNRPSSGSQWSIAGNRRNPVGTVGNQPNKTNGSSNGGYYIGSDGHRYSNNNRGTVNSGTTNRNNGSVGNQRTTGNSRGTTYNQNNNSNRNSNYNSNRNSNNGNTRNSGSYNTGRSSGNGSFGSGSFGGSRGGGGGRGGRR